MDRFKASASEHAAAAGAITDLGGHAAGMWDEFVGGVAQYDGWWGSGDDFSRSAHANWVSTYQNVQSAGAAIFDALAGAAQSTHDNAQMLSDAQGESAGVVHAENTHH